MNTEVKCDLRFLRPQKAEWTQKWYDTLPLRENIKYSVHENAVIFPLKRFQNDNLMFGRGGCNDFGGGI